MLKFRELLEDAVKELEEEEKTVAKGKIKERLREIRSLERAVKDARVYLEKLLEEEV